ncbi:S24 family peptidase [Escherichia coli]|uniref:S24 family peptidase n=1 Tax=Escherichia coli TaxID=562 RepID=UPI003F4ED07F
MTYILRVIGDSMIDEYRPGDMIFVDPEVPPATVRRYCIDARTGETTFKRLKKMGHTLSQALNPNWPEPTLRSTVIAHNWNCDFLRKTKKIQNQSLINVYEPASAGFFNLTMYL